MRRGGRGCGRAAQRGALGFCVGVSDWGEERARGTQLAHDAGVHLPEVGAVEVLAAELEVPGV